MSATDADADFKERVERWLAGQMPIISMHGGTSAVQEADPEVGRVVVELGGACSGCAINTRTAQNIKLDLAEEFDAVEDVVVRVNDDGGGGWDADQPESFMGIDRTEGGRGGKVDHVERGEDDAGSHF